MQWTRVYFGLPFQLFPPYTTETFFFSVNEVTLSSYYVALDVKIITN